MTLPGITKVALTAFALFGLMTSAMAEATKTGQIRVPVNEKLISCYTTLTGGGGYGGGYGRGYMSGDAAEVRVIWLSLQGRLPGVELNHLSASSRSYTDLSCNEVSQLIEIAKEENGTVPATLAVHRHASPGGRVYESIKLYLPLGITLINGASSP